MTIVSDMKTNGLINESDVGRRKVATRYFEMLEAKTPLTLLSAYDAVDAVHSIAHTGTIDGGNYTITVTLRNGETFTTASILFSANAATIESAINTAATSATITGWTNGDISVSGGNLATAPIVLTFDGASVSGTKHPITTVEDVDLESGALGAVTITTGGHPEAPVTQLLTTIGPFSVSGAVDVPANWSRNPLVKTPKYSVAKVYAEQAALELQDETAHDIVLSLLGY